MLLEISNSIFVPCDEEALRLAQSHIDGTRLEVTYKKKSLLTGQQRKAIHVYCDKVAREFNKAGIVRIIKINDMRVETSWSGESVKRDIWYTLQDNLLGTESVNDLDRKQVNEICEIMNRDVVSPNGVHIPFPRWQDLAT